MKIICYGDSNTYGYDPRAYFGGRYTADSRWVDILEEKGGHEARNYGQNGRSIPTYEEELRLYREMFQRERAGLFIVMLGSNDLLQGLNPRAVAGRMERFIKQLPFEKNQILLLAPPPFKSGAWVEGEGQIEASKLLAEHYRQLAEKQGIHFADAGQWAVELAYDGVHFTEKGHRAFAKEILNVIDNIKEK